VKPIWILEKLWTDWEWTIYYVDGMQWRNTVVKFVRDATLETPTIKFISEKPGLQYNLEIRGKCIGQPNCNLEEDL